MHFILDFWLHWLAPVTSWRACVILMIGFMCCFAGFKWRNHHVAPATTPDGQMLKIDYDKLLCHLHELKPHRRLYAITEVTLDVAFPLLYTSLLSVPILLAFGRGFSPLTLIPLATGCFDLVENFTVAWLVMWGDLTSKPWVAHLTLWAGKTKMILFYASFAIMTAALLTAMARWFRAAQS